MLEPVSYMPSQSAIQYRNRFCACVSPKDKSCGSRAISVTWAREGMSPSGSGQMSTWAYISMECQINCRNMGLLISTGDAIWWRADSRGLILW